MGSRLRLLVRSEKELWAYAKKLVVKRAITEEKV